MNKKIEIGQLKHFIEVQELEVKTDEFGFQVEKWTTVFSTRAMLEFDKSYKLNKEVWSSEGIETFETKIFTFRKHPKIEIHTRQRIKYKDKSYQIYIANDMDEEGRFIQIWANRIC